MSTKPQHERITLRIPKSVFAKAKAAAEAEHISLNSFVVRATAHATNKTQRATDRTTTVTASQ